MLRIGMDVQLLLDDLVVERMSGRCAGCGLRRAVRQPAKHPLNPVIRERNPWEMGVLTGAAVAYDAQARIFHMWYRATAAPSTTTGAFWCYARSRDGVRWHRPELGLVEFGGSKRNNIIAIGGTRAHWVTIAGPPVDPRRKFFGFCDGAAPQSVAPCWSADGIHWEKGAETGDLRKAPEAPVGPEPRYVNTGQCWAGRNAWGSTRRRGARRVETSDLQRWGGRRTIFEAGRGDPRNLEFYTMKMHDPRIEAAYHGFYLGFLHCFHANLEVKTANLVANSGSVDVELAVSRDTLAWERVAKGAPFLPLGRRGAFDSGMVFLYSMVARDDKLYFYYAGYDRDHAAYGSRTAPPGKAGRARIGLATLERDRLAYLEPKSKRGWLTTRPFILEGERLLVNADAGQGRVVVQVLDADGSLVKAESTPISSDSLRHDVRWQQRGPCRAGPPGPAALPTGRVVRLRFIMHGRARLYGFQVAGPRSRRRRS